MRRAWLVALVAGVWPQVVLGAAEPPRVTAVEVRADAAIRQVDAWRDLVEIVPGEPLDEARVRRTLRGLYATGAVSEAEVWSAPDGDGLRVTIAVWESVMVQQVRLHGQLGLDEEDLRQVVEQRPAEPLVEDRILRSVYRLGDLYRERGYFAAEVRVRVEESAAGKRATVTFEVHSGARAKIGAVHFTGDLGTFTSAELTAALSAQPGKRYRLETVRDDAERLQKYLAKHGYLLAEVEPAREDVAADRSTVDLGYAVRLGPRVEVEIRGADRAVLEKRGLLPFLTGETYDEALLLQAVDNIRAYFQERGHYQVKVERSEERSPDRLRIVLHIVPGPVFTLEEVRFNGNAAIKSSRLSELIATTPKALLRPGSGRLVDQQLKQDFSNLRSFYALQGYGEARIGPEEVAVEGTRLRLTIPIFEGPHREVRSLTLSGLQAIGEAEARRRLSLHAGGPYHPLLVTDSVNALRLLYLDRGYEAVQVQPRVTLDPTGTYADVALDVLEGPQSKLGHVVLRGNQKTREAVLRKFVDLRPGDPVSRPRLLALQSTLYRLGVFSRVDVALQSADEDAPYRNLVLRLEEGPNRRVQYGVGYDSEKGVSGLLGYSHGNLFGRLLTFQAEMRRSQVDSQYRLLLKQPYLGPWLIPVTGSIFSVEERNPSFDSRRRGVQVELTRDVRGVRYGALYTYKIVDTTLDPGVLPSAIDRSLLNVRISSITPGVFIDRRDDALDPHRGWSAAAQLEYAFPAFIADTHFLKLLLQATEQVPMGEKVLAVSARFGAIEPLASSCVGGQPAIGGLASCAVPISERFFAGGRTTQRAYGRDELGIAGATMIDGSPVGGDGLALLNVDYRFPIGGALGGVVFVDSGNVWADWHDVRPRDFKTGVGLGLRYLSPIGPLRVEVGYKLDREPGEKPYQVYLSFGTPF